MHNRIAEVRLPDNVGDFRLLDRRVVEVLRALPENRRFMKGIFAWAGFNSAVVEYVRPQRASGATRFTPWRLWTLALEGITSFSTAPLHIWTYLGSAIASLSFVYAVVVMARVLWSGIDVPGYASLMTVVLFLGGLQLIGSGGDRRIHRPHLPGEQAPAGVCGARRVAATDRGGRRRRTVMQRRPQRGRLAAVDLAMQQAASYAEWHDLALEHDRLSGAEDWRADDHCEWIHSGELRATIARLRLMRRRGESWALLDAFQDALFRHQGECAQPGLYQVARAGTKRVIVGVPRRDGNRLAWLLGAGRCAASSDAYRLAQVKRIGRVYGRPALMLSGGALLGLFRFGVVKALFEQDLLPRSISGSSMGSIMARVDLHAIPTTSCARCLPNLEPDQPRSARAPAAAASMLSQGTLLDQGKLRALPAPPCSATARSPSRCATRAASSTSPSRRCASTRCRACSTTSRRPRPWCNSAVLASCAVPVAFKPVQLLARRRGKVGQPG